MTEEEAQTKWCPFSRRSGDNRAVSGAPLGPTTQCIASACMAWRVRPGSKGPQVAISRDGATRLPMPSPEAANAHAASGWIIEGGPPEGFCGLAGAPQ